MANVFEFNNFPNPLVAAYEEDAAKISVNYSSECTRIVVDINCSDKTFQKEYSGSDLDPLGGVLTVDFAKYIQLFVFRDEFIYVNSPQFKQSSFCADYNVTMKGLFSGNDEITQRFQAGKALCAITLDFEVDLENFLRGIEEYVDVDDLRITEDNEFRL